MRKSMSVSFGLGAALALVLTVVAAPSASALMLQDPQQASAEAPAALFSADQLDNLVAPVALYADPLLAQVLLAATFPDQITEAAQYVRANGTDGIDDQYWDVSVKAVAHYPTILNMMDSRIDWTTSLGQAYAQQSTDVMQAVQHMRALAQAQGNLQSTPQQQVVADAGYISIWPAQPQYIYVPVYDPDVIYWQPVFGRPGFGAYFSFGTGYPIGAWLMYDWDWPARRIVYTGWYGGGWIARSRPYIRRTSVYLNVGYRHVRYNPGVIYRRPDYGHVRVYRGFGGHRVDYVNHIPRDAGRTAVPRGGHGVVSAGSGYHQSHQVQTGAHVRVMPPSTQGQQRVSAQRPAVDWQHSGPVYRAPQSPARVQPRTAAPRYAPRAEPRYTVPSRVQPRYVAPPQVQPRYTQPTRVQPRYMPPTRVQPRYVPPRAEPRYDAPRSAPRAYVRPAPARVSAPHASAQAGSRSAQRRGGHGNE